MALKGRDSEPYPPVHIQIMRWPTGVLPQPSKWGRQTDDRVTGNQQRAVLLVFCSVTVLSQRAQDGSNIIPGICTGFFVCLFDSLFLCHWVYSSYQKKTTTTTTNLFLINKVIFIWIDHSPNWGMVVFVINEPNNDRASSKAFIMAIWNGSININSVALNNTHANKAAPGWLVFWLIRRVGSKS